MECLENIIGISRTDCLCVLEGLTDEQKQELSTSVSGLYLDELEGAISIKDVKHLDTCGEYFRLAKQAIKVAKKRFEDDITIALGNQYENKAKFIGELGRSTFAGFLNKKKPYQFLQINPRTAGDATIRLENIRLIVSEPDNVNFYLLAGFEGETPQVIYTTTVETLPNIYIHIDLPENKVLPTSINGRAMQYYFAWQGELETQPRDNKLSCGCSGGNGYEDFVVLKGGQSDNLALNGANYDEFSHGFNVNVTISCEAGSLVCREYNSQNKIAVASSNAILNKANEVLNELILASPEISRLTMMHREYLWGKRNHFRAEYQARIDWLALAIDVKKSGCWICRDNKMFVGNIFE